MIIIKKINLSKVHVFVLIFSLLPFLIGMSVSIFKSSDREYLSLAINMAGSQRMRTMLISNYAQQLGSTHTLADTLEEEKIGEVLSGEAQIYNSYTKALIGGDKALHIKANKFSVIRNKLESFQKDVNEYLDSVDLLLKNPEDSGRLKYITGHAMALKNNFHEITEMYQAQNDAFISDQRTLDAAMISLGILITIVGLTYTNRIKQQEFYSQFDYLTKCLNRHSFMNFILENKPENYCLFFMDLNKFKAINDLYGHDTGDQILISTSHRLRLIFGSNHFFRYGGDEFVAVVPMTHDEKRDTDKIEALIDQVRSEISNPIADTNGNQHIVGVSMGVARGDIGTNDWFELVNFTDQLMYDSKTLSSHVITCISENAYQEKAKNTNSIEKAINEKEIIAEFTPFYHMDQEGAVMYAVVARWRQEGHQFYPSNFMSQLRKNGLLSAFDTYMIQELFIWLKRHKDESLSYVVNVTEETLFGAQINGFNEILKLNQDMGQSVYLKVQDTVFLSTDAYANLLYAKGLGYKVAIDIFSIDYIFDKYDQYSTVDAFKIGHEFVRIIFKDSRLKALLKEYLHALIQGEKIIMLEGLSDPEIMQIKATVAYSEHIVFSKIF